ncbi:hypothetical protein [Desulfocurvibacter africanus]|uniref:hypothetical protein n=1 Tax=Desulfocurvibacter africanus TaxID=873 RepID=UPI00110C682D|nr:hypothetical protein [Desulfocurvibacter africanus]
MKSGVKYKGFMLIAKSISTFSVHIADQMKQNTKAERVRWLIVFVAERSMKKQRPAWPAAKMVEEAEGKP